MLRAAQEVRPPMNKSPIHNMDFVMARLKGRNWSLFSCDNGKVGCEIFNGCEEQIGFGVADTVPDAVHIAIMSIDERNPSEHRARY